MANKITDKVADGAKAVADAAKTAGNKVVAGAEKAMDFVKDKTGIGSGGVKERMEVFASCGTKVGVVDHVEGETIKLTRNDSPDGMHHFVPLSWVDHVDSHVHLKKNSVETEAGWKPDAASCGCA